MVMFTNDLITKIKIRDITTDDIDNVYQFIVKEQGDAEIGCIKEYIQALIKSGELRVDGEISYPLHEVRKSRPPKTDFLKWIVGSKGFHFGKIACLNDKIIGVLLCYTQPRNHKAFLSNMAVANQYRRRGVGSALMRKLIDFYRPQKDIEAIELNVGVTNSIAVKFYLEHGFKIKEIRDLSGYTMEYCFDRSPS